MTAEGYLESRIHYFRIAIIDVSNKQKVGALDKRRYHRRTSENLDSIQSLIGCLCVIGKQI